MLVQYTDDGFYSWNEILIRTIGEPQKEELTKDMYIDGNYDVLFDQDYEEFIESFEE